MGLAPRDVPAHSGRMSFLFGRERDARLLALTEGLQRNAEVSGRILELLDSAKEAAETGDLKVDRVEGLSEILRQHEADIRLLREEYSNLRAAVADGIEHEERREKRIKATVARARKQLEEFNLGDPALEAEAAHLRPEDADGSGEGEVPPLSEDLVEFDEDAASSVPGVTQGQMYQHRLNRAQR